MITASAHWKTATEAPTDRQRKLASAKKAHLLRALDREASITRRQWLLKRLWKLDRNG